MQSPPIFGASEPQSTDQRGLLEQLSGPPCPNLDLALILSEPGSRMSWLVSTYLLMRLAECYMFDQRRTSGCWANSEPPGRRPEFGISKLGTFWIRTTQFIKILKMLRNLTGPSCPLTSLPARRVLHFGNLFQLSTTSWKEFEIWRKRYDKSTTNTIPYISKVNFPLYHRFTHVYHGRGYKNARQLPQSCK